MRPRAIMLTIVLAVAIAGSIGLGRPPSSGQEQKSYAAIVCCNLAVYVPEKWIGTDHKIVCRDYMESKPEARQGICDQLRKFGICSDIASYCSPTEKQAPDKKCEKPTPGLGGSSSSGCKDVQNPQIMVDAGVATLSLCGYVVFSHTHDNPNYIVVDSAYKAAITEFVKSRIGSKVCCDTFLQAVRTGTPCDPTVDVDCDGKPNQTDSISLNPSMPNSLPDINIFSRPDDTTVDPFPDGLNPDDPNFFPPAGKCDCKWELVKGTLNCSPDGKQRHSYQARWRCASTGNEVFTRKEAPPTAPCTPASR